MDEKTEDQKRLAWLEEMLGYKQAWKNRLPVKVRGPMSVRRAAKRLWDLKATGKRVVLVLLPEADAKPHASRARD